jgi:hypothetical protein
LFLFFPLLQHYTKERKSFKDVIATERVRAVQCSGKIGAYFSSGASSTPEAACIPSRTCEKEGVQLNREERGAEVADKMNLIKWDRSK